MDRQDNEAVRRNKDIFDRMRNVKRQKEKR